MKTALLTLGLGATLAGALALAAPADAQPAYPSRPITLVVPFPPGGATDALGRVIAQKLGQQLGQTIVVENRAGAGTAIGAGYVAKAAPDGYTLLVTSGTTFTVNPAIQSKLPYDPVQSFEPIGIAGRTGLALLANPQVPVKDLKELIAYVKARGAERPAYGSYGAGTTAHFVGEAFLAAAGIQMTHVPYKGSSPAMTDLIGGQIPFSIDTVAAALPQSKQGKVRVLAISAPGRSAFLPDVPTFAEQGYPSVAMDTWLMFAAPRGLSADVKNRLEAALRNVVEAPDVRKSLEAQGFEPAFSDSAAGEALIRKELPLMRELAQRANIKLD
ncbi:tripartite tricarboxylate transporter substrate binding protein [Achromobacter sp. Marseille-Q0513]|uniref:Bug family tripartite tricarboxylate transporter substrate binding protein n=1 Tax=Achromobacter sp. Marseille-Q0513 TaxID=2829161 RepID=UPI001B976B36|nr:tripartite tricarboxylate transporter substrate binding protein [Achromobacter sp. Marseille-Q0513]MBR8656304.1 tripartite tricarboxylate transporter substrate binding protein [Achromobacter sp. Marseille-Q0513]